MSMRSFITSLILTLQLAFLVSANAAPTDTYEFSDPVTELRYKSLTKELRCPKCQNQNLADSNSMQAGDLRREIYNMLMEGKSDGEIVDFMVYRYGDFVLYRPKVNSLTYVLWFGPAALVLLGIVVIIFVLRRKTTTADKTSLTDEQQDELNKLLDKEN